MRGYGRAPAKLYTRQHGAIYITVLDSRLSRLQIRNQTHLLRRPKQHVFARKFSCLSQRPYFVSTGTYQWYNVRDFHDFKLLNTNLNSRNQPICKLPQLSLLTYSEVPAFRGNCSIFKRRLPRSFSVILTLHYPREAEACER